MSENIDKRFLHKYDGHKLGWLRFLKLFLVLLIFMILVMSLLIGVYSVDGESMYPTLRNNQTVVFLRTKVHYEHGDIVALRMPSGDRYVKRVVAVAGEEVDIHDGQLFVNGQPEEGAYVNGETEPEISSVTYPVTLREGQYFVLGDNRAVSVDSRSFGTVDKGQILGKILFNH